MGEGFWARVFLVGTVYLDFTCKVRKNEAQWIWSQCITCVCGFAPLEVCRDHKTGCSHILAEGAFDDFSLQRVFLECPPNLQIQLYIPTRSSVVETIEQLDWLALCSAQAIHLFHFHIPRMEEFKQRWFVTFSVLQHWASICLTPVKELILVLPQWI